jgi:large-conductance mechanosensitive channel
MHPAAKVIIGLILIIIGLGLFVDEISPIVGTGIAWVTNFLVVLSGVIPIFLILIGLFIVWLEIDELKTQKELKEEEKPKEKEHKEKKEKK